MVLFKKLINVREEKDRQRDIEGKRIDRGDIEERERAEQLVLDWESFTFLGAELQKLAHGFGFGFRF